MMWAGGFCLTSVRDVAPLSLSPSWERSSLFPPRWVGKTENREQRNNCTKYSPAVAMATGPSASWPRKMQVWLPLGQTFGYRWDRSGVERTGGGGGVELAHTRLKHTQPYRHLSETQQTTCRSRAAELLLKLRNLRCCNASKSTLNY